MKAAMNPDEGRLAGVHAPPTAEEDLGFGHESNVVRWNITMTK
jgi:hypothetical protein